MSVGLPLMKNTLTSLIKSILIPLGLTAAAAATDATIQKKIFGSGTTALIIPNEEMKNIMKIVKACVHYIFASLFCLSKREHFKNMKKYYFTSKTLFVLEIKPQFADTLFIVKCMHALIQC